MLSKAQLKFAVKKFSEDEAPQGAAALAFYAVSAFPPLMILMLSVLSLFYSSDQAAVHLLDQVEAMTGRATRDFVFELLQKEEGAKDTLAAVVGGLLLLLGASAFFAQLQAIMNRIWGVEPDPDSGLRDKILKRLVSMLVVLGVGGILLFSLLLSTLISATQDWLKAHFGQLATGAVLAEWLLTALLLLGAFALIIKVLPDADVSNRAAWVGALAATLLFSVGKLGLSWYLGRTDFTASYGSAGALVLLLFWIYYSSMIFLLGAEVSRTLDCFQQEDGSNSASC